MEGLGGPFFSCPAPGNGSPCFHLTLQVERRLRYQERSPCPFFSLFLFPSVEDQGEVAAELPFSFLWSPCQNKANSLPFLFMKGHRDLGHLYSFSPLTGDQHVLLLTEPHRLPPSFPPPYAPNRRLLSSFPPLPLQYRIEKFSDPGQWPRTSLFLFFFSSHIIGLGGSRPLPFSSLVPGSRDRIVTVFSGSDPTAWSSDLPSPPPR